MSMFPDSVPQSSDSAAPEPKQPKKKRATTPSATPSMTTPPESASVESNSPSSEAVTVPPETVAETVSASVSEKTEPESNQNEVAAAPVESEEGSDAATYVPTSRGLPIPPPSEPMQYRAIGLVKGRYIASASQFTQGILLTTDGTVIDAVLLGRVMSLVKKHLNLEEDHLWVVYPRTRQNDGNLHTQILGVWEPKTLAKTPEDAIPNPEEEERVIDGYFSIRGEVIFQSVEQECLVVKIRQAPRKPTDKPKYFKLKLSGKVPTKAVGHFWDLLVQRQGEALVIQEGDDIGLIPGKPRKSFKPRKPGVGGGGGGRPPFNKRPGGPPRKPAAPPEATGGAPKAPVPKPVKRQPPQAPIDS
ncbi:hypothetical protein NG798_17895 [Ancylothrix sp. C2]|uniref:hypothetical protein n=1 Tax=Ancylothrix sp. D3o TaxID=2953691 RepID=UPI0021BABC92|nr:hypothetical protein [Ancylothrix sp. D3o]MCT7951678.1 hypothetical protein [Ancylothrix sp. D3o]